MKTHLDCLPCLLNQALKAARAATDDECIHRQVINAVASMIPEMPLDAKPPELAQQAYRIIRQVVKNGDPFYREKTESNRAALAVYPRLKQMVRQSADSIYTACKLAIAGNSIDLGPANFEHSDLDGIIDTALEYPLAVDNYDRFLNRLRGCRRLLYIGDNAGEIVFDRLLIEELQQDGQREICFVVRGEPVINDATMEDAAIAGLPKIVEVIDNGSDAPGTILETCCEHFKDHFEKADLIIAKGQGNYETLSDLDKNIFFILKAKCPVIAEHLDCQVGTLILRKNSQMQRICGKKM